LYRWWVGHGVPYSDPDQQRAYQRDRYARCRAEWFAANGPCVDCGSQEELQLDHVDPSQKISHKIWSWSPTRREAELSKCVIRCKPCHDRKSSGEKAVGQDNGRSKVTEVQVMEIRETYAAGGVSIHFLSAHCGVSRSAIRQIINRETWRHI
jgi:hypothetical protein